MTDTKFSQGPWHAITVRHEAYDSILISTDIVGDDRVCFMSTPGNGGDIEAEITEITANAALIAAAPDLYAALKQIIDDMGDDGVSCCPAARDQGRAALAKARGEPC